MDDLRAKGKLPPSYDSSPGAFAIEIPHGHGSGDVSSPDAPSSRPEPVSRDEVECKEEEVAVPGADADEATVHNSSSHISATIEAQAYAVQEVQEDVGGPDFTVFPTTETTEEPKIWRERPVFRVLLSISCLLALIVVIGVVALVMFLTKTIGGTPSATLTPTMTTPTLSPVTLTPTKADETSVPPTVPPAPERTTAPTTSSAAEQIACDFLNVTECRSKVEFGSLNSDDSTTGSTIPSEIAVLTQLTYLDVCCTLSGTIPTEIARLTRLRYLSFTLNFLSGSIPSSISQLSLLTYLDFSHNSLSGSIPSSLSTMTNLRDLAFQYNELTGRIPSSISKLTQLTELYFHNNSLSGTIPSSLCNHVEYLWIDCNRIECNCCFDFIGGPCA